MKGNGLSTALGYLDNTPKWGDIQICLITCSAPPRRRTRPLERTAASQCALPGPPGHNDDLLKGRAGAMSAALLRPSPGATPTMPRNGTVSLTLEHISSHQRSGPV